VAAYTICNKYRRYYVDVSVSYRGYRDNATKTFSSAVCLSVCLYWSVLFMDPYIVVWSSRNTNKMQTGNRIYYSKVYWGLNMFRAAHRSSSGALNCICSLWFICPYGDRPLSRPWQRLIMSFMYFYCMTVCLCMTTLTEVFSVLFPSCKANARVMPAKTGHGPHCS
jgi:hypothetical protein